jgi:hypothetical protein
MGDTFPYRFERTKFGLEINTENDNLRRTNTSENNQQI